MTPPHATVAPGARNTFIDSAVATPTVSGVLLCPKTRAGRALCMAASNGCGWGASFRKGGGMAESMFRTPHPPDARRIANGGFQSHSGAFAMQPTTPTTGTTRKPITPFLTDAQRLRAAARHALRAANLLEQISDTEPEGWERVRSLAARYNVQAFPLKDGRVLTLDGNDTTLIHPDAKDLHAIELFLRATRGAA